jgi:hypothetical protein
MKYEKVQIGWFMIILFSIIIISLTICYLMKIGDSPLPLKVYLTLIISFVLVLLTFYRLKIRVDDSGIHIIYGIGLVNVMIKPEKINLVSVIKTSWFSGFGIRITENGMLYNIQGENAIEISYELNGKNKNVQVGTNDVLALKEFIEKKYNVHQPLKR